MTYQAGTANPNLTAPGSGTESASFGSAILEADLSGTVNGNSAGSYRWTGAQTAGYSLPVVSVSGATTLSYALHNNRFVEVTASATLTVPSASTLTSGFRCEVVAVGSVVVTLSGTLTDYAGNSVTSVPAGKRARIFSDGTTVYCEVNTTGGGATLYSRPALSTLTWLNQGTATATEVTGGPIVFSKPAQTAASMAGLYAAAPSAPYTFTTTLDITMQAATYYQAGLILLNSSSGAISTINLYVDNIAGSTDLITQWSVGHFTNSTSASSTAMAPRPALVPTRGVRLRAVNDATNITYLVSVDGAGWLQLFQETLSAAGSPNSIGFYGQAADPGSVGLPIYVGLRGWEVVNSASPQAASVLVGV